MLLEPTILRHRLYQISPGLLQSMGVKAIALDVDNTLTLHNSQVVPPEVQAYLQQLQGMGFRLFIISNNSRARVAPFAGRLGLEFVCSAAKPLTFGLRRACRRFGVERGQLLLVGDQLFTDILAARLFGCPSALVTPFQLEQHGFLHFKRLLERPILRRIAARKEREDHE